MPQLYENEFKNGKAITTLDEYYNILNHSSNLNSNLTDGNKRSHRAFRNNIGDIVSVLQSVDTTLIGTSEGFETFSVSHYKTDMLGQSKMISISESKGGDGTVLAASAFALTADGKHRLKYKDFAGEGSYNHMDLAMSRKPIQYVCDTINGKAYVSLADEAAFAINSNNSIGMSDNLKINYSSDKFLDVNIYDENGTNVAQISDNRYFGFNNDAFSFTPLEIEEDICRAVIYIPNSGYRITFGYGNEASAAVDFEAEVSTLDTDGWNSVSVTDTKVQTSENGLLASYDGTQTVIDDSNISEIVSGTVQNYLTDWKLPTSIELDFNSSQKVEITGEDAEQVSSTLIWSSSDESIVSVSSDGIVTAAGYGKVTISGTDGNKTESCEMTVKSETQSVSFQNIVMTVGERTVISPQFTPANATQTDMVYTYEEGTVIKIDEYGVIQALAPRTITVTGTATNGVSNTFTVTVTDADFTRKVGDINGDDRVDIIDLIKAKKHIVGAEILTGVDFNTADLDKNNTVNSVDLILLRKILLGIDTK